MGIIGSLLKHVAVNAAENAIYTAMEITMETNAKRVHKTETPPKITMSKDYDYYRGKNYKAVQRELEKLGFCNIIAIPQKKSLISLKEDGEVKQVSIGGRKRFKAKRVFFSSELVTIEYYTRFRFKSIVD